MSTTEAKGEGPALAVDGLTKQFGDRVAFQDVSFEVGHGEVFGFLGPNGAGKTTTVRTLGTLIAQTSGSATVAGLALKPENGVEIRRRIAIMPEAPGLYLRLSVAENLECFAGLYETVDPAARIDVALSAVNLSDRADDLCSELSKGLRQRVALARALLGDPQILFLDEPTSGLDPVAARGVHELIDELRARGVTIFLTTHRLDEAERLCDRVAILNTTLRTIGRPDELRERLFAKTLAVRTATPLADPGHVFTGLEGVEGWQQNGDDGYVIAISDATAAAPAVTRALVHADADVLSITPSQHSLQDVYLELIDEDVELEKRWKLSSTRIKAIVRKELRDYRRSNSVVVGMGILPLIFTIQPIIEIFTLPASSAGTLAHKVPLLYMLGIPALVPATLAASAVVSERQLGTLEPVLSTPIRREEFLLAKAFAVLIPALAISYTVFGLSAIAIALFAHAHVASAVLRGPELLAQVLFTPLIATLSIWLGIAISTRASDTRVAQQLSTLASLPMVLLAALFAFGVFHASVRLAVGLGALLLVLDIRGWRYVSVLLDRERLITGHKG